MGTLDEPGRGSKPGEPNDRTTSSQVFTMEELRLLHAVVRHEVAGQESWRSPPASLSLNAKIAYALLLCLETKSPDAALDLTWHDCLVIDFCVQDGTKSADGKPIGMSIFLKNTRARQEIETGGPTSQEPVGQLTAEQVVETLKQRELLKGEE